MVVYLFWLIDWLIAEGSGGVEVDEDQRYSPHLSTPERRSTFAERLRDALHRGRTEESSGSNDSSNYAVGIQVAGSQLHDKDIKSVYSIPYAQFNNFNSSKLTQKKNTLKYLKTSMSGRNIVCFPSM